MIYLIIVCFILVLINVELLVLLVKTGRQANKAKRMIKRLEWAGYPVKPDPKERTPIPLTTSKKHGEYMAFTRLTAMNKCLVCREHFTKGHVDNCFMGELTSLPWIKFIDGGKK